MPVPTVDADDDDGLLLDAMFLDLRDEADWETARIPGSAWAPRDDLEAIRWELPMDRRIVVVAGDDRESTEAVDQLLQWGLDAALLDGGLEAWVAAGRPVDTSTP